MSTQKTSLAKALHFNDAALATNREGQQTRGQRRRMLVRFSWMCPFWIGLTICLFTPAMLVVSLPPSIMSRGLGIILAFIGVGISFDLYRKWRRAWRDWQSGKIAQVTGTLQKNARRRSSSQGSGGMRHIFIINEQKFRVQQDIYHAFERGKRYTLYYFPHSKIIASAVEH